MPLYEYSCRGCDKDFEVLVTSKEKDEVRCPHCEGTELVRHFGLPARGKVAASPVTNCRGDGPPCGAPYCGRKG